jgi:hypothetical protein
MRQLPLLNSLLIPHGIDRLNMMSQLMRQSNGEKVGRERKIKTKRKKLSRRKRKRSSRLSWQHPPQRSMYGTRGQKHKKLKQLL